MSFAFIDVVFAILLLFFAIGAAVRGLIQELFSKAAFVLGTLAAILFFRPLASRGADFISNSVVAAILAFVLAFSVVFVAVKLVQHIIAGIFEGDILGSLNHALGCIFGPRPSPVPVSS